MSFFSRYIKMTLICATTWLLYTNAAAQTSIIDSLKRKLYLAHSHKGKLNTLLLLCEQHQSMNRDTLNQYALLARQLAYETNEKLLISAAELAMANSYLKWGWTDSALASIEPQLKTINITRPAEKNMYFKLARLKALCYGVSSKYKLALDVLYDLVQQAETYRDTIAWGANLNTIGSISIARNQPHEAINWFRLALKVSPARAAFSENLAAIYTNMANAYNEMQKNDSAVYFIEKAIPLSRAVQNLYILGTGLRIKSNVFIKAGKIAEAETALKEMQSVRNKTSGMLNEVDENLAMIDFYLTTKQINKAIKICKENLQRGNIYEYIASPDSAKLFSNNINIRVLYYQALARCYKAAGNIPAYQQTLENIINAKDSSDQANSARALAEAQAKYEVQTKYEVQKKENTIIQQNLDIAHKDLDLTRKNYLIYGSLLLLLSATVIAWQIFRNYRRKQKIKMLLMQQEEKRLAVEAVKDAEENERKRIAADLHDNLGAYAASIASNLDYISVLPGDEKNSNALQELRTNSQSIVSQLSDTIWALNKESLSLTAISDRIKVFLQRIGPSYPGWKLDVAEKIATDHSLPPSQAFHLFQIVQEAIINAVKHSGGRNVQVLIEGGISWKIVIADDGRGMSEKGRSKEGGNGLLNMNSRSLESGWNISWQENSPSGVRVNIEPTTN